MGVDEYHIRHLKRQLKELSIELRFLHEGGHHSVDCENDFCGSNLPPLMEKEEFDKWVNLVEGAFLHRLDPLFVAGHMRLRVIDLIEGSDRLLFTCNDCGHTESVGYEDSTFKYQVYNEFEALESCLEGLLEEINGNEEAG